MFTLLKIILNRTNKLLQYRNFVFKIKKYIPRSHDFICLKSVDCLH